MVGVSLRGTLLLHQIYLFYNLIFRITRTRVPNCIHNFISSGIPFYILSIFQPLLSEKAIRSNLQGCTKT